MLKRGRVATVGMCGKDEHVKWSILLGRVFGVEVRLHVTFLLLLGFFGWAAWKATGTLSGALAGLAFHLALFGCVLLHEFGHVLMAKRFGIRTKDVTLLPIGGVARLESTGNSPKQELLIALAGPAVNLVIAAFAFGWWWLGPAAQSGFNYETLQGSFPLVLMAANLFLLGFNLLPAFPMDGGRVLRALLSWNGNRVWATQVASNVGRVMAVLFAFAGLFLVNQPMLLFIALFVWIGATQENQSVTTDSYLAGVPVRKTMLTEFRLVSPFHTLEEVSGWVLAGFQHDFPVVAQGEVLGLILRDDLFTALREKGPETLARDVMRKEFVVATPEEPIDRVLRRAQATPGMPMTIPVLSGGILVGLVTAENVGEYVMMAAALRDGRR